MPQPSIWNPSTSIGLRRRIVVLLSSRLWNYRKATPLSGWAPLGIFDLTPKPLNSWTLGWLEERPSRSSTSPYIWYGIDWAGILVNVGIPTHIPYIDKWAATTYERLNKRSERRPILRKTDDLCIDFLLLIPLGILFWDPSAPYAY